MSDKGLWCVVMCRYCNESGIGITSLEWYPDTGVESGHDKDGGRGLYFADIEGYIGWFEKALPVSGGSEGVRGGGDGVRGGGDGTSGGGDGVRGGGEGVRGGGDVVSGGGGRGENEDFLAEDSLLMEVRATLCTLVT